MKRLFLSVLTLVALFATLTLNAQNSSVNKPPAASHDISNPALDPESKAHGVQWAKGVVRPARPSGGSHADMTWHSGAIMTNAVAQPIFWGTSWAGYSGDKMTGMDTWYSGFGGSKYAATSNEYTGTNGQVTSAVTAVAHAVDTTAATSGQQVAPILAEVCKVVKSPVSNGYYAVYTDLPRGSAGYCAWHSYGTCGSTPVQIAFFWKLDGDAGCDPQDSSGLHSQGLAAIANVSGHELSEARTDPRNGGWYDSRGDENGDKCAWTYGAPLLTFSNGSQWKIQGEWSNKAFDSATGYPNNKGQNGCLGGN
ncbi:MAG: hypothetical protein ACJ71N_14850 [Terriglobales bacterium]|jgi:hypothetical protein